MASSSRRAYAISYTWPCQVLGHTTPMESLLGWGKNPKPGFNHPGSEVEVEAVPEMPPSKRDVFYRRAKEVGFRARSAFKLLNVDEMCDIFSGNQALPWLVINVRGRAAMVAYACTFVAKPTNSCWLGGSTSCGVAIFCNCFPLAAYWLNFLPTCCRSGVTRAVDLCAAPGRSAKSCRLGIKRFVLSAVPLANLRFSFVLLCFTVAKTTLQLEPGAHTKVEPCQ